MRAVLRCLLVGALVAILGAGCTVRTSAPDDWDTTAQKALEEAASLVASSRLALETRRDDEAWDAYATILLTDAEKAVATAVDSVGTLQPPPERADAAEEVEELLDRAASAIQTARRALVGDQPLADLIDGLDRLHAVLDKKAASLG